MKTCERYSELFSDYAENTLASEQKHELEAHLHQCAECRSAAGGVTNLRRAFRDLSALHTSPDFETILRTRIKLDRRHKAMPVLDAGYGGAIGFAAISVAVIILFVGGFYLLQYQATKAVVPSPSTVAGSPPQALPNKTLSSLSSAKIYYAFDKITPQLQPNWGVTRKNPESSAAQKTTDSLQTVTKIQPETAPVSFTF